MHFEHDVFISYAHIDNEVVEEGASGWVAELHRFLEVRVSQLVGEKASVWRDPKLQGNDVFADSLVDELRRTALLATVLSPRYARSEWCMREVTEFRQACASAGGTRVGNKTRLFKIVKTPIPPAEQPRELQDTLGYEFFVVDPATGRARELDPRFGQEIQQLYWAKLDDLAFDMSELLQAIHRAKSLDGAEALASDAGETVYLAETTSDLQPARDEIRRDLLRRGHTVLPDQPLPVAAPALEALVREQIARCRLSIHPVGGSYGFIPEGASRSVLELQNELAVERAAGGDLLQLVWIPPGVATEDERQRAFLDLLRNDPTAHERSDVLEVPIEDLTTYIDHKLKQLQQPAAPAPELAEDRAGRVYLMCEEKDLESTRPLEDLLFDQGCEVVASAFEGDETEIRQDHEENLRLCDAALVYYGAGSELWLRRKLRELLKSAGLGRSEPLKAKAVYVAPPETPAKERLRSRDVLVIRPRNGSPSASDLTPWLKLFT